MENTTDDLNYIKNNFAKEYQFLNNYLLSNKIVSFWLSPKMAGRSTYEGYLMELFPNKFRLISAGDIVRNWQAEIDKDAKKAAQILKDMLKDDWERAFKELSNSDVKTLVSEEIFLKLLKAELESDPKQSLIIDGFPRTEKQVEQAIEIAVDLKNEYQPVALSLVVSSSVLNLRMSSRRVCPNCNKVGNLSTLVNSKVEYNKKTKNFYLSCLYCNTEMVKKKTDTSIEDMLERREREKRVSEMLVSKFNALGFLGMNVVTDIKAATFTGTDEQLNPAYNFTLDSKGLIKTNKVRQESINEDGTKMYNFHPRYAVVLIIRALTEVIKTKKLKD